MGRLTIPELKTLSRGPPRDFTLLCPWPPVSLSPYICEKGLCAVTHSLSKALAPILGLSAAASSCSGL